MSFLIGFVNIFFWLLQVSILLRVLFSWIRPNPYNPLVSLVYQITDPLLQPLSRVIPTIGMFDVTPIIAWILLSFVQNIILTILNSLAY